MSTFERFLAGEDALARLIRAQPAFEPSTDQEARLLAAISSLPQLASQDFEFEPPAHMEAAFLQQMHAVQQSQAPRRDALLTRLQSGEAIDTLLGHPVSSATQAWVARQQPAPAVAPSQTAPRARSRWWEWGGLVLAGAMFAAIGVRFLLPSGSAPQAQMAINERASAPQEVAMPPLAENGIKIAEPRIAALPPAASRRTAPLNTAPGKPANLPQQTEAGSGVKANQDSPMQLAIAEPPAMVMQERSHAKSADFFEMPSPVAEMESRRSSVAAVPPPAPQLKAARKAAPEPNRRMIRLTEAPAEVAQGIAPAWVGQALILYAANPQSSVVQDWAERLRKALPPGTGLTLLPDAELEPDSLLLVRP